MNSRRGFLAGIGAAVFAPHALPAVPLSREAPSRDGQYVVGVLSNPSLSGPERDFVLKTWVSVADDGTGFGVLTDRYDSRFGSHLAVHTTTRHGNRQRFEGIVIRSNEPRLVRQPFVLAAAADGGAAALELVLLGQSFFGRGLITRG